MESSTKSNVLFFRKKEDNPCQFTDGDARLVAALLMFYVTSLTTAYPQLQKKSLPPRKVLSVQRTNPEES